MLKIIFSLLIVIPLFAQTDSLPDFNFKKYYDDFGVEGCFLLYDLNNNILINYNSERCSERFIPASTFKIFNSMAALESGVIKDQNEIIKWDSVKRFYDKWNQDLDMRKAFKFSAVWFYQELARRIGEKKMQKFINENNYGNMNISGGIDHFWLDGELRISPIQQLEFLKKLYSNNLKFSERSQNIVKEIMLYEEGDNYKIRAKTGWGMRFDDQIGWFVGWVEKNNNVYFFVNNCQTNNPGEGYPSRIEITRKILSELRILP
jgi:beta-lactamase class D